MPETTDARDESQIDDYGREFIAVRHRFPANAFGFLLAPAIWMLHFLTLYSLQGIGCARGYDRVPLLGSDLLHVALGAVTGLASVGLVAAGYASFRAWRRLLRELEDAEGDVHGHATFLAYGALLHAALFLLATLWGGIPVMLLDACDSLGGS